MSQEPQADIRPHLRHTQLHTWWQGKMRRWHLPVQVLIAESYGGADEPVDTLLNGFVQAGVEPALDPLRVKSDPNEATYQVRCLARQPAVASSLMSGQHHEPAAF